MHTQTKEQVLNVRIQCPESCAAVESTLRADKITGPFNTRRTETKWRREESVFGVAVWESSSPCSLLNCPFGDTIFTVLLFFFFPALSGVLSNRSGRSPPCWLPVIWSRVRLHALRQTRSPKQLHCTLSCCVDQLVPPAPMKLTRSISCRLLRLNFPLIRSWSR